MILENSDNTNNTSQFSISYFRSARLVTNSKTNEFKKITTDSIKQFIQHLFNINCNDKSPFSSFLKDSNSFNLSKFESYFIDLGIHKNGDSGIIISGAFQEIINSLHLENNENFHELNLNTILTDDYCINLKTIIKNKIFSFNRSKKKEAARLTVNKRPKEFNQVDDSNDKPIEKKKTDITISTSIVSRDSRKIMNEVLNELMGDTKDEKSNTGGNYRSTVFLNPNKIANKFKVSKDLINNNKIRNTTSGKNFSLGAFRQEIVKSAISNTTNDSKIISSIPEEEKMNTPHFDLPKNQSKQLEDDNDKEIFTNASKGDKIEIQTDSEIVIVPKNQHPSLIAKKKDKKENKMNDDNNVSSNIKNLSKKISEASVINFNTEIKTYNTNYYNKFLELKIQKAIEEQIVKENTSEMNSLLLERDSSCCDKTKCLIY